jgi:hypothetical protein
LKRDYQPDLQIKYTLVVPDVPLDKRSIFQGFTREIFDFIPLFHTLVTLPPNLFDPSLPRAIRLARHAAGQGAWFATPASMPSLLSLDGGTILERPFFVTFTSTLAATDKVAAWAETLPVPVLQVALRSHAKAILPAELTYARIQSHVRAVMDALSEHYEKAPLDRLRAVIDSWQEREVAGVRNDLVTHLTTIPNLMSLKAGGIDIPEVDVPWTGPDEAAYVTAIAQSYDAVQALRDEIPFQPMHRITPAQPDVFVVAPAHYQIGWSGLASSAPQDQRSAVRNLLNGIERQSGFRRSFGDDAALRASALATAMLRERVGELTLFAHAVGLRAASTLSAVVRVPPAVNRANGLIGQLGRLARSPQLRHRADLERSFAGVQQRLATAVGPELTRCIRESVHGVKIISDAPLEWMPVGDLPLGLAHVTSRLTATPGDLLYNQLVDTDTIQIPVNAFDEILVVSAFKQEDRLDGLLRKSIDMMAPAWAGKRLSIRSVDVSTLDEFVDAFNGFNGPLAIFDGHGSHDGEHNVGHLMIREPPIDVWKLRGRVRCPPIVMLSACDTQAAGRSHATAANGFIFLGARAVLGTLLPIYGVDAALFIARMMLRIAEFVPAAIQQYGRGVLWSEMVTGLLRMHLLSDLIMALRSRNLIDDTQYQRIGTYGNGAINSLDPTWLEQIKKAIMSETGMGPGELDRRIKRTIATSDAIRYTHIGNPETIVIGGVGDVAEAMLKTTPQDEEGKRLREASELRVDLMRKALRSRGIVNRD